MLWASHISPKVLSFVYDLFSVQSDHFISVGNEGPDQYVLSPYTPEIHSLPLNWANQLISGWSDQRWTFNTGVKWCPSISMMRFCVLDVLLISLWISVCPDLLRTAIKNRFPVHSHKSGFLFTTNGLFSVIQWFRKSLIPNHLYTLPVQLNNFNQIAPYPH